MCGIFGFTGPPAPESLAALRLALRHRGPDGEGELVLPAVSLGCDRLAIVSPASGAQPLANEDGSLRLVCNGEIYNHRDLRRRLEARGHRFATGSDSEVVLHAFEEEGAAAPAALHGMFALALWDEAHRQLLLARDASGMKPLHYAWHEGRWWFASEAKALLLAAGLPRRLDLDALDGLLRRGFVPGPHTLFAGIARLPAGHCLAIAADGQPRLASFAAAVAAPAAGRLRTATAGMATAGTASAGVATFGGAGDSLAAELRRRLAAAVESHLEADVPVGASLSGGLDSSLLVALMAERAGPGVKTFAIGCPGDQDERPFARRVADRFRTEHTEIAVRPEDLWARLPRVLWNAEEPRTGPLVPNDMLFERAARDVRVLLVGEGADELFGGYLRFKTALPPLGWLPRSAAAALYGTRQPGAAADLYGPALAAARGRREPLAADFGAPFERRGAARLAGLLDYERRVQLPNAHLARVDLLSMAHAVEARLPYLDAGVVALAERVPLALKVGYRNEKMVLREAARGLLPPAIAARRKLGQANPFRLWDEAGMLDLAAALLGPAVHARGLFQPRAVGRLLARLRRGGGRPFDRNRLHLLVLVEVWHRVYLDPARLAPPAALAGLPGLGDGLAGLAPSSPPASASSPPSPPQSPASPAPSPGGISVGGGGPW